MTRISRRALIRLLAGSAAAAALPGRAASPRASPKDALARLLGLAPAEQDWLQDLTRREQAELLAGLSGTGPVAARTLRVAEKLLSRRSHLFPYLGYPQLEDKRTVCDGLVRE